MSISTRESLEDLPQELALVLLVPPKETAGFFIVLKGLTAAQRLMALLGLRGCLRGDLSSCYELLEQLGEGEYALVQKARATDGSPAAETRKALSLGAEGLYYN